MCSDDGREETVTDLVTLQKDSQRIEHLSNFSKVR
jgi:recombinational DNA repair protein RecR